jgi:hypothetical protein
MCLLRCGLTAGFLLTVGLVLGCGEQGGKPMKDQVLKPGEETAKERDTKTKGGAKPQGIPPVPQPDD